MRILLLLALLAVPSLPLLDATETTTSEATAQPTQRVITRVYPNIPRLSLAAYAGIATEVVHGIVVDKRARLDGPIPRTEVILDVKFTLKDSASKLRSFVIDGLEGPDAFYQLVGGPSFKLGEEVVVFLWTDATTGTTGLLGLEQGTYRVRTTAQGQRTLNGLHARAEDMGVFFSRVVDAWAEFEHRRQQR